MPSIWQALEAKEETIRVLEQAIARKDGDVQLLQMANQDLVVSKEETISTLQAQVDELMSRDDAPTSPIRFRWAWLNRLLTAQSDGVG